MVNGTSKNGSSNGVHAEAAVVERRGWTSPGTGSRPQRHERSWGSPWTPAWSPSARAAPGAPTRTSRATRSSTRPTGSSASAVGATSWSATLTLREIENVDTKTGEVKRIRAYSAPVRGHRPRRAAPHRRGLPGGGRGDRRGPRDRLQGGGHGRHEAGAQELRRPVRQRPLRRPAGGEQRAPPAARPRSGQGGVRPGPGQPG